MLQMGAAPSQMLQHSIDMHQSAKQQRSVRPPRNVAANRFIQAQIGHSPAPVQARASSGWMQFPANVEHHDEEIRQKQVAHAECMSRAPTMALREVYQPTSLRDGQRVDSGRRIVQEVQHGSSQDIRPPNTVTPAEIVVDTWQPVTMPADSMGTPAKAVMTPEQPLIMPVASLDTPARPSVTHAKAVTTPTQPIIASAELLDTPTHPATTPAEPAAMEDSVTAQEPAPESRDDWLIVL